MSKLLRGNGYEVDCAASVTEALELLKANRYDILISDIGLPDGSGLELMQQTRVIQPMPGIALSGFGMEQDIRRSKEAGFAEHLIKPLNFQLLVDAIERLTANTEAAMGAPDGGVMGAVNGMFNRDATVRRFCFKSCEFPHSLKVASLILHLGNCV